MGQDELLEPPLTEKKYNPQIIAECIDKKLLLVNTDRNLMTLTIQCKPNLLKKEQLHEINKYIMAIEKEFNEFKKNHKLSDNSIEITKDIGGNRLSLRITMPTLALYDAFIQQLETNLLPSHNPQLQGKDKFQQKHNSSPNPLLMEPKPSNKKSIEENFNNHENTDSEDQTIFNPSPFSMKPK